MSENVFKPGDLVHHVAFDMPLLFVVKVLEDGRIGCRYRSFVTGSPVSNFQLHYMEFETFELKPNQ